MYYVQHAKAYGHYLYIYKPEETSLYPLRYSWTLKYEERERFATREDAEKKVAELLLKDYQIRPERPVTG